MSGPVALIQGGSRGIGLQFVHSLLRQHPCVKVIATSRSSRVASSMDSRVDFQSLDVREEKQIETLANYVDQVYGRLDLLINCSAILHPSGRGETRLSDVSVSSLESTLRVNTLGPLLMVKHLLCSLQRGQGHFGRRGNDHKAVVINMSARVGSIEDNRLGGWYSYRISKAALNMANKNLSLELARDKKRKIVCLLLHPGTVDTQLSRPYHRNVSEDKLFSTEFSVGKMLGILDTVDARDSGRFIAWDGQDIPF